MGEELYTQKGFLFRQFWPIDIIIVESCVVSVSLKSPSSVDYGIKKIFSFFAFYRELSRLKVL